jgi:hypothetical protein
VVGGSAGRAEAQQEHDLTPFIPGASPPNGDPWTAPSDPLFHAELSKFLTTTSW